LFCAFPIPSPGIPSRSHQGPFIVHLRWWKFPSQARPLASSRAFFLYKSSFSRECAARFPFPSSPFSRRWSFSPMRQFLSFQPPRVSLFFRNFFPALDASTARFLFLVYRGGRVLVFLFHLQLFLHFLLLGLLAQHPFSLPRSFFQDDDNFFSFFLPACNWPSPSFFFLLARPFPPLITINAFPPFLL